MFKKIFILTLFLHCFSSIAYSNEKTYRYSYAMTGINLRENKDLNSRVVANIEYGVKFELIENTKDYLVVDNIKGNWLKVNYKNKTGYVFSGYTSIFPPPRKSEFIDSMKRYSLKEYNEKYLLSKGQLESQNENDYLFKTYFTITNASVLDGFLLYRLIAIYPKIGLINLPKNRISYKLENKAIEVMIENKKDKDGFLKYVKVELLYYESSGKETFVVERCNENDIRLIYINELP